jgi:hypothetical protein
MATPAGLVRLSQVRDATGVSIRSLDLLIGEHVIPGAKYRNSTYCRVGEVPTREQITTATRGALARWLRAAEQAAERIRAEYEATCFDAREAIEQLEAGQTPLRLGDDLTVESRETSPLKTATQALFEARLSVTLLHRVLVEISDDDRLVWPERATA